MASKNRGWANAAEIGDPDFINRQANALAITAASEAFVTRVHARAARATNRLAREQARARDHTAEGVLEDLYDAGADEDAENNNISDARTASLYSVHEAVRRYPLLLCCSVLTIICLCCLSKRFIKSRLCRHSFAAGSAGARDEPSTLDGDEAIESGKYGYGSGRPALLPALQSGIDSHARLLDDMSPRGTDTLVVNYK
mmetsp:Transcript_23884/g.39497  ORF Transcript_23884/g.39497 Transcript_23884/m.39497 type:complete len:199 (+) Transcript_23884:24-620(+)|eukprot:CAMPEP_0119313056 /NCGR_PEP_ID=MMETSP1333-20130426/27708_1 /TAXON_ID=418940 /ORGANISM="Scyphosphaera apsteinii, Strain RCC1455" /LENGTH=198 /DNA_ID=CAMNT_0007317789 /DNA_START=18 /DNA_END=614 /DNA_ORIENTATION=+